MKASATPQGFTGTETTAAVHTSGPAAQRLELRKVDHSIGEIRSFDLSIVEATLHQHGVGEVGIAQIGSVEAAREGNDILKIRSPKISTLELRSVDHSTTQIGLAEIHLAQVSFEEFLLFEIATMHIGSDVLNSPLPAQLRSGDRICSITTDH